MFENSIQLLENPRYLGNAKVVDGLVRDFVAAVMNADDEDSIVSAASRMGEIFAGIDSTYVQVEGWCSRDKLGHDLERYLNVDGGQSFYDMTRTAFVQFAAMLMTAVVQSGGDVDASTLSVDELIKKMTAILMGAGPMAMQVNE